MESHPTYENLAPFVARYPRHAQSLFQVYNDIVYTQRWTDVTIEDIPELNRVAVRGKKDPSEPSKLVVPCSLAEDLSIGWITQVFESRSPKEPSLAAIWVGIVADDSSLVYYKLSKGIIKPPM